MHRAAWLLEIRQFLMYTGCGPLAVKNSSRGSFCRFCAKLLISCEGAAVIHPPATRSGTPLWQRARQQWRLPRAAGILSIQQEGSPFLSSFLHEGTTGIFSGAMPQPQ